MEYKRSHFAHSVAFGQSQSLVHGNLRGYCGVAVRRAEFGAGLPDFKSQLCYLVDTRPWASYSTPSNLSFPIYKIRVMIRIMLSLYRIVRKITLVNSRKIVLLGRSKHPVTVGQPLPWEPPPAGVRFLSLCRLYALSPKRPEHKMSSLFKLVYYKVRNPFNQF